MYWAARISVYRTVLALAELCKNQRYRFDLETLRAEQVRMAANLLMSWQYAREKEGMSALLQHLLRVWEVAMDCDTFRGKSRDDLRAWLFPRISVTLSAWCEQGHITSKSIDEASKFLAGGLDPGWLASAYDR
jgi:hypothetical protein